MTFLYQRDPNIAADTSQPIVTRALHALPWTTHDYAAALGVTPATIALWRRDPPSIPVAPLRLLEMFCGAVGKTLRDQRLIVLAELLLTQIAARGWIPEGARTSRDSIAAWHKTQAEIALVNASIGSGLTFKGYAALLTRLGVPSDVEAPS